MSKKSTYNNISISTVEEVVAFLENSRELVMHQRLTEACLVMKAATKIAESFNVGNESIFSSLLESIKSKPFYVTALDIDRAILILKLKKESKKQ